MYKLNCKNLHGISKIAINARCNSGQNTTSATGIENHYNDSLENSEYYNAYLEQSRERQRGQPLKVYTSTGGIKSAKGPRVFRATVFSSSPQVSPKNASSGSVLKESASALALNQQTSKFTPPRLSAEQIRLNKRFNVKVL